jgi:putative endonuclease
MRTNLLEGVIQTLDLVPGQPAIAEHLQTGHAGELAAFFYLRRQGYKVVARDWKSPRAPGDIDLIAWQADTLCFVEVKARTSHDVATAESAIDKHKRETLRRLAGHYVRHMPDDTPTRFDVLSIYYPPNPAGPDKSTNKSAAEITLYRGAFDWSDSGYIGLVR